MSPAKAVDKLDVGAGRIMRVVSEPKGPVGMYVLMNARLIDLAVTLSCINIHVALVTCPRVLCLVAAYRYAGGFE